MITYILQVTLCLGCFYGLYYFALRRETLFLTNRAFLLTTLIASVILPWIKIYLDSHQSAAALITAPAVYVGAYMDSLTGAVVLAPAGYAFPWESVIISLYLAGVGIGTHRLLRSLYDIWRIRKEAKRVPIDGNMCLLSQQVETPFSFFNDIYLPVNHPFTTQELREVLSHESAHIRARHTWDVLLMESACILIWPSPFVYLYRKSLREVHEYAADAEVIKDTPWDTYAQLLVAQQHYHLQHTLSNQFYSQLKNRLRMMNQKPSSSYARLKYFGIVPVLLLSLIAFSFRVKSDPDVTTSSDLLGPQAPTSKDIKHDLYADRLQAFSAGENSDQAPEIIQTSEAKPNQVGAADVPVFPGCEMLSNDEQKACSSARMMEFITRHLVYPDAMRHNQVEGKVFVRFIVTSGGWVSKAEVIRSFTPEADQAALDVVNSMNQKAGKWQPAVKDGKAVDTELVLPFTFAKREVPAEEPYQFVEEMPRFPGCEHITVEKERFACVMEKMYQFIGSHLWYPEEDRKNKVEGTGIVQFVIEADGQISDIKVVRSPSQSMTTEMTRLMGEMASMPEKWIPGRHEGKAVPVRFTLPIKFVLQSDTPTEESHRQDENEMDAESIAIAPNPGSSSVTITTFEGAHLIRFFDASGKAVLSQQADTSMRKHTVNVSHLPPGQYVVKAFSDTNSAATTLTIAR